MTPQGQTIQVYLPTGDPAGIRIAGIPTRTVQLFEVPRSLLPEFLARDESGRPAVYYLIGETDEGDPLLYAGQSNVIGDRLRQHQRERDDWERALVAISLTNEWSQTHISYLEWESIRLARASGRYLVSNRNAGMQPHATEPLRADCAEYLGTIRQLLATLGHPALDKPRKPVARTAPGPASPPERPAENAAERDIEDGVEVVMRGSGATATGIYSPEGVLVLAGSAGRLILEAGTDSQAKHRGVIISLGAAGKVRLTEDRTGYTFVEDHLFPSPSAAASALACDSRNGRLEFKLADGRTIKRYDEDQVNAAKTRNVSADPEEGDE